MTLRRVAGNAAAHLEAASRRFKAQDLLAFKRNTTPTFGFNRNMRTLSK